MPNYERYSFSEGIVFLITAGITLTVGLEVAPLIINDLFLQRNYETTTQIEHQKTYNSR